MAVYLSENPFMGTRPSQDQEARLLCSKRAPLREAFGQLPTPDRIHRGRSALKGKMRINSRKTSSCWLTNRAEVVRLLPGFSQMIHKGAPQAVKNVECA